MRSPNVYALAAQTESDKQGGVLIEPYKLGESREEVKTVLIDSSLSFPQVHAFTIAQRTVEFGALTGNVIHIAQKS